MTVLDVGCGNFSSGDVNCDLYIKDIGHRTGDRNLRKPTIDPKKIKNFVLCDCHYLPFRNNIFESVRSIGVIEHIKNPHLLLKEMIRVSNDSVVLTAPHWLGDSFHKIPYHIHLFNKKWFFNEFKKYEVSHKVEYSKWKSIPSDFFPLFRFPWEIKITLRKNL